MAKAAGDPGIWTSDPETNDSWYGADYGVADQGGDSTKNTGRVWTDKSVYAGDAQLTNQGGEPTFTVENDAGTALVELSALSSAASISGQTTINQPLDIILVLDRSGSMSQNSLTSYEYSPAYQISEYGNYFVSTESGSYAAVGRHNYGSWLNPDWGWRDESGNRVYPMTSASDSNPSHIQFYTRRVKDRPLISEAMETAVTNFIDTVADENVGKTQDKQHRVAIVDYAASAAAYSYQTGDWPFETTHYFTYCTQGDNEQDLKDYVTSLQYRGGTQSDKGFEFAQNIMDGTDNRGDGARDNAKKVVIFFTDGMPGDGDYVENTVAGPSVNTSREMKSAGVTVYSVGVFQGADPDDLSGEGIGEHDANYFMNAVSSNYPTATSRNTNSNVDFSYNCTLGARADGDYYFAAADAESLNNVFQSIYDDFGTGATSPILTDEQIGGENVGYLTFTDTLGNYTEVKNFKSIIFAGQEFTQVSSAPSQDGTETTYTFTGAVDNGNAEGEVYPGNHNLSDIKITVKHGATLEEGDTVTVEIPSSLLPLRLYKAETTTVDGESSTTTSVKDAYPIRVFYTVGLKDELMDGLNIDATKLSSTYINSHTDDDGNVFFYSNDYAGGAATTTATFTPATTNSFYYFTEDTPIYTAANTNSPAGEYREGGTYYYQRTYYANEQMRTEWVSFTAQRGQLNTYVRHNNETGTYYIAQGSPRLTRAEEFVVGKAENTTQTAAQSIAPSWSGNGDVTVRLGNNGKISYPISGSLEIGKTVDWGTTGVAHNDKEFTYAVDLGGTDTTIDGDFDYVKYNAQGQPVDAQGNSQQLDEGADPVATGQIADGGTLKLKNGERVVVDGLPANTAFTVTETQEAGYTPTNTVDSVQSQDGAVATGSVKSNDTVAIAYTNTYSVQPSTLTDGSIHGTKVLTGRDWKTNESFTFMLSPVTEGAPLPAGAQNGVASVTLTNDGNKNYAEDQEVTFAFGGIEYTRTGEYTYLVQETEGEEYGLAYSNAAYRVTVSVTDDGAGNLSASIKSMYRTFDDNGDSTGADESQWPSIEDRNALFTNRFGGYDVDYANITGRKVFTDYTTGDTLDVNDFHFTLTAVTQGAPMPGETRTGNLGTGVIEFSDIEFGIDDIGKTYEYEVKEEIPSSATDNRDGTATLNGMTYDTSIKTVSIAVTQDADSGSVVATVTGNGFEFTNSYRASSATTDGGNDGLQITKQLDGAAGAEGQFEFTMAAANDETAAAINDGSVTGITSAGNIIKTPAIAKDGSASVTFPNLTFTRPGTYTFNVTETQNAANSAWKYDNHTYQVSYTVTDVSGQLTIDDPATSGSATFTNTYSVSMNYDNEAGGIMFSKTLNGRAMTSGQFEFVVAASDDSSAAKLAETTQSLKNEQGASDGVASTWAGITDLTFDQDDAGQTYTFVVSEVKGSASGYTYDEKPVTIEIAVADDGDGSMSTTTTITKQGSNPVVYNSADFKQDDPSTYPTAQFVNGYDAADSDPASVVFEKRLTGRDWKETDTFSFTLTTNLAESNGVTEEDLANAMPSTTTSEVKGTDAEKTFKFGGFTFSKTGVYAYSVSEVQPTEGTDTAGVTYSKDVAIVLFTVTDPGTGKLQVSTEITGVQMNEETGAGIFTNIYEAEPITTGERGLAKFQVTKVVSGAPAKEDFSFDLKPETDYGEDVTGLDNGSLTASTSEMTGTTDPQTLTFDDLTFYKEGVYKFNVVETTEASGTDGWTYASGEENAQTITVTVTDEGNDGTLDATTFVDGEDTNNPTFVNSYEPGSTSYDPTGQHGVRVTKNVVGNGSENEMGKAGYNFTISVKNVTEGVEDVTAGFKITNANGTSDENGAVDFEDITFTQAGVYEVTVAEIAGKKNHVTYDDHKLVYTLNVTDTDYDGELEVAVDSETVAEGENVFTNIYFDEGDAKHVKDVNDVLIDGKLVGVGETLEYTIDWVNTALDGETGAPASATVTIVDTLPQGVTPIDGSYGTGVYDPTARTITWTIDAKAAEVGTVSFQVKVDAAAAEQTLQNTASVNDVSTNTVTNTVPGKTETTDPDKIGEGAKLTYKIVFTNTDGADASATVVDTLTKGQDYVENSAKVNDKDVDPTVEGDAASGQTLTWELSNLGDNETVTITFDVTITREAGAEVNNTATVNGHSTNTTTTPYPSDDKKDVFEADDPTTSVNGKLVGVGDELTYTIDWAADEDGTVTITDVLPAGTELVADSISDSGTYDEATRTITWSLGEKSEGDKGTVSFNVVVTDAAVSNDPIKNTATITVGENDPKVVTAEVDIPKKTVEDNTPDTGIQVGDVLTYTIEYRNDTDASAKVVITDKLPEGLTFIVDSWKATEGHNASLDVTSDGLVWTVSDLAAGASGAITFSARVNEDAIKVDNPLTNQATVTVGDNNYKTNTTNDGDKPGTGDLTISKTVTAAEGETPDYDKSFSFTIALKDAGGNPLQGSYAYTIAGGEPQTLALDSGVAKIELKHDQSVTIADLPEGATYSVAEDSYADEGYVTSLDEDSDGWSGTIDADGTFIKVTNDYAPQSAQLVIEGNKRLVDADGNAVTSPTLAEIAGEFSFTIKALDGGPLPVNTTATNNDKGKVSFDPIVYSVEDVIGGSDETVESPEDGVVEDDATNEDIADGDDVTEGNVSDDEDITSDDTTNDGSATNEDASLEMDGDDGATDETVESTEVADLYAAPQPRSNSKTFKYEVTENPSTNEGIAGDATVWTVEVTVTVGDDGDVTAKVTSATAVPARTADEGSDFTFVNTVASSVTTDDLGSGALQVTKKVDGAAALEEFSFRLTPASEYGDAVSGLDADGGLTAMTSGLKGNVGTQTVGFSKLTFSEPGTYRFNVIETNADPSDAAWTYDNDNAKQIVVTVSGDADGDGKLEISTMLEDVDTNNPIVTNKYDKPYVPPIEPDDPDETDPSKPDLDVDKTLTGRDMVAGEFSFTITATGDNADHVSPQTLTGTNDASGNVSFSGEGFKFDEAGEYTFTVSEVLPQDDDPETPGVQHNGVTYDETTYTITAKVTKGAGNKLVVSWDLGAVAPGVTFHNEYEPDETAKVTVNATKVLIGRDLAAGEFTFELVDAQGNVVGTATNNADGSVSFSPLEFTEAGTYTYTLREVTGGLANVTYDTTVHTVTITVVDNGDGTLTATVTYDSGSGAAPVFTNTYKVPDQPGKPEEPSEPERPDTPKIPDAGDHTNVALPAFLAVGGAALIACACLLKLRKSR